jgi:UDP-N-acetylglucosamine--dolichyl-phosphate N-acetylglucosaminephosphotransferase
VLIELSIILFIISFLSVSLQIPYWIKYFIKIGKTGIDIHKENKPHIPEMGGVSIIITASILGIILYVFTKDLKYLAIIGAAIIGGIIGLLDDLIDLGGKLKPILTLLTSIPILALGLYYPRPALPFIPSTQLTILYPILIPIGMAVASNAVNMLDVINGATPLLLIPIFLALIAISLIFGNISVLPIATLILGSLIAFYIFNKYPAKIFMGNCGDFYLGAFLGAIAIVFSLEVAVLVAMFPYIMNGFYALSSVGRLFERKEIKDKPVIFRNNLLNASLNKHAPMTLLRIIVAKGPLTEKQAATILFILSCTSSILAVVTEFLTKVKLI